MRSRPCWIASTVSGTLRVSRSNASRREPDLGRGGAHGRRRRRLPRRRVHRRWARPTGSRRPRRRGRSRPDRSTRRSRRRPPRRAARPGSRPPSVGVGRRGMSRWVSARRARFGPRVTSSSRATGYPVPRERPGAPRLAPVPSPRWLHPRRSIDDYERRSFWQATMAPLPDRSGRPLPDTADVVVIGGGYAGINAARELARRGVAVTLLEAHTLGWGASTRNGGIVHAGYKWGPRRAASSATARRPAGRSTARRSSRMRSSSGSSPTRPSTATSARSGISSWPTPRRTSPSSRHARDSLASVGVTATVVPRDADPRGDRHGRLLRRRWSSRAAACSIRDGTSRARRGRRPGRRGPPRGRPGDDDPAAGRRPVRRRDRARCDPGARRLRRDQRLHRRRRARRSGAG